MNRVVKTVKTYDYGNGVFVEKVNGEISRYWCEDKNRVPIHVDQMIYVNKQRCDNHKPDPHGRYCYFVDPIKKNTVVLWKSKTQLLKGIPEALVRLGYMDTFNRYAEKETAYISSTGPVSNEVAQRDAELEEFKKKPTNEVIGRFKQPTIPHFTEGQNARVSEFANMKNINLNDIIPEIERRGKISVDGIISEIEKIAAERDENKYKTVPLKSEEVMIVNELDDGNKPLDIVDPPCGDMMKKASERQKQTLQQLYDTMNKDIERKDRRTQIVSITERTQDKYGTLFNCIRIFGSKNDEEILEKHVNYQELYESVTNGFDVAIAVLQTRVCAHEELNVVKNLLSDDEVIHLLGVLQDVI